MSEHQSADAAKASDITDRAADWIQRRDFWNWSNADQTVLDAWLAESMAHRIAYYRLDAAWSRAARLTALRPSMPVDEARESRARPAIVRTAAALVVASLLGAGSAAYYLRAPEIRYETHVGEHKTFSLKDGSQIELNTDTALRVSTDLRTAILERGEAYFQIKHYGKHPFAVIAGDHRVTDLGTKFLIRSDPNRLEVTLVEGRAEFDAPDRSAQSPIVLMPGDHLVVADNLIRATRSTSQDLANTLGWRRGMLIFDNAPLGDVVAELNRYNAEKVVMAGEKVADIRISASFRTNGIEDLAQLAQAMLGLQVRHLKQETVISR